jgi:hypothetical protein
MAGFSFYIFQYFKYIAIVAIYLRRINMGVRHYPKTPRVYLDQDGPLYNFEQGAKNYDTDIGHLKRMAGAYIELPLMDGAVEAVKEIWAMGFEVFVLTKAPDSNPYAASEKLLSIKRDFPSLHGRVIISSDKGCVGTERDILVDDHPEWANADHFPGKIITFTYDWQKTLAELHELKRIVLDGELA